MSVAILLGLLLHFAAVEARLKPCGQRFVSRRALKQSGDSSGGFIVEPARSYNGTVVQTLEVDLLQEMCLVSFNSYYPVGPDHEVLGPTANLRTSAEDCCAACAEDDECNVWQWCPREPGCPIVGSNTTFPYLGCQLLKIAAFSPYVQGFAPLQRDGEDITLVAGAPFNMTLPQLPGYSLNPGTDMGGIHDYSCPASSVADSCMVLGTAQEISKLCNNDDRCKAFVYFPQGVAFDGSGPVGVLKEAAEGKDVVEISSLNFNPTSASYLKDSPAENASSSSSNTTIIVAVVASVVGGIVLIAVGATLLYVRRKYKRMAAAVESPNAERKEGSDGGLHVAEITSRGSSTSSAGEDSHSNSSDKYMQGQESPPSVVDVHSGNLRGVNWSELNLPPFGPNGPLSASDNRNVRFDQMVVVSEVPLPGSSNNTSSGGRGMPPGSSARELLEAFSQMYAHRPPVDYVKLAEMLEDDEAAEAAAQEEAQAATLKEADKAESWRQQQLRDQRAVNSISIESGASPASGLDEDDEDDVYSLDISPTTSTDASGNAAAEAWSISPEEVEVCRRPDGSWWQLGTGAFGTVYKGLYHGSQSVAIKVLHRLEEPRHTDAFAREVALLKTLHDRHVVQFLGACINGPQGTAMLVTELMELGDLWRALPARNASGQRIFAWHRRGRKVLEDVANGLKYLHSKRIVHFDLKSANILLSRAGTAKLADIGMARVLNKSYLSMVSSGLGTFAWSAPEVLAGRRCGCKADIFSFGVVLWEVCTGEAPVRGILRPLHAPADCPAEVVELQRRCMAENPEERPSAAEVLDILKSIP